MAVVHNVYGKGLAVEKSPISVGGFDVKVKFENGMTIWCSWKELHIIE